MFSVENIFMSIGSRKKGKSHFGSSIGCYLNFNALEGGRGEGLSLVILTNQWLTIVLHWMKDSDNMDTAPYDGVVWWSYQNSMG